MERLGLGIRGVAAAILLLWCGAAPGADLELYPGAKTDEWVTHCLADAKKVRVAADKFFVTKYYVTPDPFDRVVEFYGKFAPARKAAADHVQKLPDGSTAQIATFFPGGAPSGVLVRVQRPAACASGKQEVRDVTLIEVTRRKKK